MKCIQCKTEIHNKIKKGNICRMCHIENEKPYILKLIESHIYHGENSSEIYKVLPKKDYLRLHCVIHYEVYLSGIKDIKTFKPLNNFNQIWNMIENWINPEWHGKYKGCVKRGLYQFSEGEMYAVIEDNRGTIYYIVAFGN